MMSFRVFESLLTLALAGLTLSSCATPIWRSPSLPPEGPPPRAQGAEEVTTMPTQPSPRVVASLRLTDQGRTLLEQGKTDDAISLLERAVSLHPTNGENYYYLAKAWLVKGNLAQAEELNDLAAAYLERHGYWIEKVLRQREQIQRERERTPGG
jgi:predicted Zn-dependent protease